MSRQRISPRQFMQTRRPERFSDSVGNDLPILDRSQLEYHLHKLTSRSEELAFETFARHLLEHIVCPNLLPHTGPTGGGDSKVDTETYPVAEAFAMAWFVGNGNEAATERWAFAFSVKEEWKPKLKSDIAKIVATERGYTKAFFVSNQFIPDRVRAATEDALKKKHGIDVRIFDRNWILDKVFSNRLEQLAIEELHLTTVIHHEVRKGPLDTEREQDLQHLEDLIATAIRERRHTFALVEDCLEAAILARGLERPRTEVDGLFMRARRLAKLYGTSHQLLESVYEHAWTSFWWYEDYNQFLELYDEVEKLAADSRNAHELELWSNLHSPLLVAVRDGNLDPKDVDTTKRTTSLATQLNRLAQEKERPSTALQARTSSLLLELIVELNNDSQSNIDRVLQEMTDVVHKSALLIGYPIESFVQIITELGDVLGGHKSYENLFETIVQTATERKGELTAGRMLLTRGAQQMDSGQWYEGIRTLGRTLGKLYKYESRTEEVRALYQCALAYEKIGLLWAARGTMLSAASIATNEFWNHQKATPLQAACYKRVKWIELQLGRLPHILAWHQTDQAVRATLAEDGYDIENLFKDEITFDAITAILFLRANISTLNELTSLPDKLEEINLSLSATALQYALGHESEVPVELLGAPNTLEAPIEVFRRWRDQPAANDLPLYPLLYTEQYITLSSGILGCQIDIHTVNQSPCVELAESLLAALESLLATGASEGAVGREPKFTVNIQSSNFALMPFEFYIEDFEGLPHVEIGCHKFDPHSLPIDKQKAIQDALFNIVIEIASRALLVKDPEQFFTKLFRDDLAAQRAIGFTTSFGVVGNVLGHNPNTTLAPWVENQTTYALNRMQVWDAEDHQLVSEKATKPKPLIFANHATNTPSELTESPSHNKMATLSLIREYLWEQANWIGIGFIPSTEDGNPPMLGLLFRDGIAAQKIFAFWHDELGTQDEHNRLRISIIRGISKTHPHWYRIIVGSNITEDLRERGITHFTSVSRVCTMTPSSDTNLKGFLVNYAACSSYHLSCGFQYRGEMVMPPNAQLIKQELNIRDAWEIGRHDLDVSGIHDDDDLIIPEDQPDAPVHTLLNWRKSRP